MAARGHIRCHAARTPSSRGLAAHVNASSSQASRTHHDRGMSAVPALAAPGRVEARHRSCMPHACSRHACIASSVVGLAARRGHMGGSWSGPSSHRCAQARGPQPLKHRAKQPSTGHPRCRQARARADTGWSSWRPAQAQVKHRGGNGMVRFVPRMNFVDGLSLWVVQPPPKHSQCKLLSAPLS